MNQSETNPLVKVLFVDDEQFVLDGIRRQLHNKYEVLTALGGQRGLEVITQHRPIPVIVADMRMPEMNGIEFLVQAGALDPKATLIMLTGNADRQTAIDAGAQGRVFQFLTKPCTEHDMIAAIEASLNLASLEAKLKQIKSFQKPA